jgi:hypothetical protein
MKKASFLAAIVFSFVLPFCAFAQNTNAKQVKNTGEEQLYKIESKNLSIGNMAYTQKVLRAWKDFDNNTLDNSANMFADTVLATFPDGSVIQGKENFMKSAKEYRNSLASMSSTVNAVTTLKSPDDPQHEAVSIWGIETVTMKDGTTKNTHLNEVWFFNKEGKVARLHQMAAKGEADKK